MIRYRLHQDTSSRYATMKECSEGEFVSVDDVKAMLDDIFDEQMVDKLYDVLNREGLMKQL